jgi:hypothetical protein
VRLFPQKGADLGLLKSIESGVCTACEDISFPQEYNSARMIPKAATGSMADGLGKIGV